MNNHFNKKQIIKSGWRPVRDGKQYDHLFKEPLHRKRVIIRNGTVDQTVDLMKKVSWKHLDETKKIAALLKGKTRQETLNNIWEFIYNHIQYVHDNGEELRTPATTWYDRKGDCDCMSIFASSILTNLQIPHSFRIAKYNEDYYQHVYVVADSDNGQLFIIDCVLSQPNYEKPYSHKKDFKMSLNGIDIAVLDGADNINASSIIFAPELDDLEGLGSEKDRSEALYSYLLKTKAFIVENPHTIMAYEDPQAFVQMLDYAIKYWNTPNREKALKVLIANEDKLNISNGFNPSDISGIDDEDYEDGIDNDWSELDGMDNEEIEEYVEELEAIQDDMEEEMDYNIPSLGAFWNKKKKRKAKRETRKKKRATKKATRKQRKTEKKEIKKAAKGKAKRKAMKDWRKKNKRGFFRSVAKGIKKGAKSIIRFNPVTIAARNGFLLAMKLNLFQMADKLKWGYASGEQAKRIGNEKYSKAKNALAKIEKLFADKLQGKKSKLKNAILNGKSGGLNGVPDNYFNGLGEPVTVGATVAAAMPLIISAIAILKKEGLLSKDVSDKEVEERLTKMIDENGEVIDENFDEDGYDDNEDDDDSGDKPSFFKKYGLWILGGAAGLATLAGIFMFSGKKKNKSLQGTSTTKKLSSGMNTKNNTSKKSKSSNKKMIKKVNLK